jgi:hypothetical protein
MASTPDAAAPPQQGTLPELSPQCLSHVFSHLAAQDCARATSVCLHWNDLIYHDDGLWTRHMQQDVGLASPRGPDGKELGGCRSVATASLSAALVASPSKERSVLIMSFTHVLCREAYAAWRRAFGPAYWAVLRRAVRAWDTVKVSLLARGRVETMIPSGTALFLSPAAGVAGCQPSSRPGEPAGLSLPPAGLLHRAPRSLLLYPLQPGISEADLASVEQQLGFQLPAALKVLYRCANTAFAARPPRLFGPKESVPPTGCTTASACCMTPSRTGNQWTRAQRGQLASLQSQTWRSESRPSSTASLAGAARVGCKASAWPRGKPCIHSALARLPWSVA